MGLPPISNTSNFVKNARLRLAIHTLLGVWKLEGVLLLVFALLHPCGCGTHWRNAALRGPPSIIHLWALKFNSPESTKYTIDGHGSAYSGGGGDDYLTTCHSPLRYWWYIKVSFNRYLCSCRSNYLRITSRGCLG